MAVASQSFLVTLPACTSLRDDGRLHDRRVSLPNPPGLFAELQQFAVGGRLCARAESDCRSFGQSHEPGR